MEHIMTKNTKQAMPLGASSPNWKARKRKEDAFIRLGGVGGVGHVTQ